MKALQLLGLSFVCLFAHAASQIPPYTVGTCLACHGDQGVSVNPVWPNLAGQHQPYLLKELRDIKTGKTRNVLEMRAVMAQLNDADLIALATYYSKLPLSIGLVPQKYLKEGEKLYRGGDFNKQISACIACHGPGGEGNGQAGFPILSGQYALYTIQQLEAFSSDKRKNDLNSIMKDIAHRMNKEDMEAVAYYIQGLYPTTPVRQCCVKRE